MTWQLPRNHLLLWVVFDPLWKVPLLSCVCLGWICSIFVYPSFAFYHPGIFWNIWTIDQSFYFLLLLLFTPLNFLSVSHNHIGKENRYRCLIWNHLIFSIFFGLKTYLKKNLFWKEKWGENHSLHGGLRCPYFDGFSSNTLLGKEDKGNYHDSKCNHIS